MQIITTTGCNANSVSVSVSSNGNTVTFLGSASESDVTKTLNTLIGVNNIVVERQPDSNNVINWRVTFTGMGSMSQLIAVPAVPNSCTVSVSTFLEGNRNQFTIEPKQASGQVLRDVTTAAGFAGKDVFFTESFRNGTWYRDHGVAKYNPVAYEIQSIFIPNTATAVYFTVPDYMNPLVADSFLATPIAPLTATSSIAASSTARDMQIAIESLPNIDSVDVYKTGTTSPSAGSLFSVTFLSNLGSVQ